MSRATVARYGDRMTGTVTWLHGSPDEPEDGDPVGVPDGSEEWWSTIDAAQLSPPTTPPDPNDAGT